MLEKLATTVLIGAVVMLPRANGPDSGARG